MRAINHEGIGKAMNRKTEIGCEPIFPDLFHVHAIFVSRAHMGQAE